MADYIHGMNDRSTLARLIALLALAAFFAGASGDVYGYHDCPHHSLPSAQAADVAHSHDAGGAGPAAPHGEHSGPCTCVGTCHATASAPVLATVAPYAPLPRADIVVASPVAAVASPRKIVGRLLPYPNGPPTS